MKTLLAVLLFAALLAACEVDPSAPTDTLAGSYTLDAVFSHGRTYDGDSITGGAGTLTISDEHDWESAVSVRTQRNPSLSDPAHDAGHAYWTNGQLILRSSADRFDYVGEVVGRAPTVRGGDISYRWRRD